MGNNVLLNTYISLDNVYPLNLPRKSNGHLLSIPKNAIDLGSAINNNK